MDSREWSRVTAAGRRCLACLWGHRCRGPGTGACPDLRSNLQLRYDLLTLGQISHEPSNSVRWQRRTYFGFMRINGRKCPQSRLQCLDYWAGHGGSFSLWAGRLILRVVRPLAEHSVSEAINFVDCSFLS